MARTVEVKPRNDAYTGILAISFLALLAACLLMVLDAQQLGDPPPKLNVDVPGATPGKAAEGLRRPDPGAGGPAVPEKGAADKKDGAMRPAEPSRLPELPELPAVVVPTAAEVPADPDAPPLPVKPFVPPQ